MPTYQYACTSCGERLEAVQKFTDAPLEVCPACQGRLRKVFSAVGVVFKGSGFYRTDSRDGAKSSSDAGAKANGSAAKSADTASSGSSSSSESTSSSSGTSGSSSSSTTSESAA